MPRWRFVSPPGYKTRGLLLVRWTCKPLHHGATWLKKSHRFSHLCFSNQKYLFNYTMYARGKCDYCMYQHIILYHLFYINFCLVLWPSSQSEATTQALRLRNSKLGCGAHFTQQCVNNDTVDRKANNCAHTWQKKKSQLPRALKVSVYAANVYMKKGVLVLSLVCTQAHQSMTPYICLDQIPTKISKWKRTESFLELLIFCFNCQGLSHIGLVTMHSKISRKKIYQQMYMQYCHFSPYGRWDRLQLLYNSCITINYLQKMLQN